MAIPKKEAAGLSKDVSPSTITTQEEKLLDNDGDDVYDVVRELHVGTVIVID